MFVKSRAQLGFNCFFRIPQSSCVQVSRGFSDSRLRFQAEPKSCHRPRKLRSREKSTCSRYWRGGLASVRSSGSATFRRRAYIAPRRPPEDVSFVHTVGSDWFVDLTQPSSLPTSRDRSRTGRQERQSKLRSACLWAGGVLKQGHASTKGLQ